MLINGEKYACEACVRGHRVSNCQHSDRPLQHINKKGRPVSQCQHCRSMRKSRSAHVKCDCGEKTSKCAHLRAPIDGHRDTCCCYHGGKCTCVIKKEPNQLDPVPELDHSDITTTRPTKAAPRNRRRANTIHSETPLSFDEHGHHKPIHKGNKASQKSGPYNLSRMHSVHSTTSLADARKRSPASSAHSAQQSKSEHASPQMSTTTTTFPQTSTGLAPLDLSRIEYPAYSHGFELFGAGLTEEQALFSAGLPGAGNSVDWGSYDGLPAYRGSSFGQTGGFAGFDVGSDTAGLTSVSGGSGDVSEAEDFIPTGNDDGFCLSTTGSYVGLAQQAHGPILRNPDINLTFDDFLKQSGASKYLTSSTLDDTYTAPSGYHSLAEEALWSSAFPDGVATMPDSPLDSGNGIWER